MYPRNNSENQKYSNIIARMQKMGHPRGIIAMSYEKRFSRAMTVDDPPPLFYNVPFWNTGIMMRFK